MPQGRELAKRHSIRCPGWDYTSPGPYFVTLCVHQRRAVLGRRIHASVVHSEAGRMVLDVWRQLPLRFPCLTIDAIAVMPDHVHFLAWLDRTPSPRWTSLGDVVRVFKSLTTLRYVNGVRCLGWPPFSGRLWQRNYFERVIRTPGALRATWRYILDNPRIHADRGRLGRGR